MVRFLALISTYLAHLALNPDPGRVLALFEYITMPRFAVVIGPVPNSRADVSGITRAAGDVTVRYRPRLSHCGLVGQGPRVFRALSPEDLGDVPNCLGVEANHSTDAGIGPGQGTRFGSAESA